MAFPENNMKEMQQVWSMCHALGLFASSKSCSTFWKTVVLPTSRSVKEIDCTLGFDYLKLYFVGVYSRLKHVPELSFRSTTSYMVKWMFAVRHQKTVICWLKDADCIQLRQDEGKGQPNPILYAGLFLFCSKKTSVPAIIYWIPTKAIRTEFHIISLKESLLCLPKLRIFPADIIQALIKIAPKLDTLIVRGSLDDTGGLCNGLQRLLCTAPQSKSCTANIMSHC